jgi:hypothetical protein
MEYIGVYVLFLYRYKYKCWSGNIDLNYFIFHHPRTNSWDFVAALASRREVAAREAIDMAALRYLLRPLKQILNDAIPIATSLIILAPSSLDWKVMTGNTIRWFAVRKKYYSLAKKVRLISQAIRGCLLVPRWSTVWRRTMWLVIVQVISTIQIIEEEVLSDGGGKVMNRYSWSLNPIKANDLVFLE